ncbi:hypothetical protein [Halobaculum lipolyticum]|uniref:Uncharacterized protein n=1 Tax=Halobaculum lipolyticum TaxID=3032001 RepID=A0ABD5W8F0_9EURY|nr:hypothetical protein [Halobaculum sp. DT31]
MAEIQDTNYEKLTDEELASVRKRMNGDVGRTEETDEQPDKSKGEHFAPPPSEVA